jgi:protein-disulfide isomerase
VSYAKQLKLKLKQFKKDLGAKSVKQIVKQDLALAASLRLVGTPAVFINGLQVSSLSQMNHIAKRAWKQAQDALQVGVPARKLYELLAKNASKQTGALP